MIACYDQQSHVEHKSSLPRNSAVDYANNGQFLKRKNTNKSAPVDRQVNGPNLFACDRLICTESASKIIQLRLFNRTEKLII